MFTYGSHFSASYLKVTIFYIGLQFKFTVLRTETFNYHSDSSTKKKQGNQKHG
jgi:hypothetical protein